MTAAMAEQSPASLGKLHSTALWLWVVSGVGVISRLLMLLLYRPVYYSDTASYLRSAQAVRGGFASYDGTRTPGYPVFLALLGDERSVWYAQLLLGFATTLLLFFIAWRLTSRAWFGGLIGLAHTLNLGQLFFESNLITESLTTFLLVLSLAGACAWLYYPRFRRTWVAFALGLTSSLTLLVRPLFVFLPVYLLAALWLGTRFTSRRDEQYESSQRTTSRFAWRHAFAFALPVILLVGGWVSFIHSRYGDWSLTTMTGYHLIQHTGSFFEYVPDEFASLRDTYIRYRDAQVALSGTQANTIWEAIPEMSQVSGYNFYDLSDVLAKISLRLILEHPLLFLQSAANGWWMFWRTSVYWSADALRSSWMAGMIDIAVMVQRAVLFFINILFISSSILFAATELLCAMRRRVSAAWLHFSHPAQKAYFWLLACAIWIASILQTLLDHGDNPRFLVPLQSLVVLWVALMLYLRLSARGAAGKPVQQDATA